MQGTRLHKQPGEPDFLLRLSEVPGAYGTGNGKDWFCTTPNGMLGNLGGHQVEEHEDGTITVSPSILTTGGGDGKSYHGFLVRGAWRSC